MAGWIVTEGSPAMETIVQHQSEDGKLVCGTWKATVDPHHATFSNYEFVHMISRRIIITPAGGLPVEVGPGDACVVEAEFKGAWQILEDVPKHFAITTR